MAAAGPLAGLRVLDLTQVLAGPYCTMMLGDLGADVVKVERPGRGDGSRLWGPPWAGGESVYYLQANRNKRSLAIDLDDPDGRAVAERLVCRADVVVENFLPHAARRLELDPPSVHRRNPGAVHCSIRGFPSDGDDAERPGYDFAIQGIGGVMSITGEADGDPMKVGVAIADITAGMFAANAILAALVERAGSGRGRAVEVSLIDAQVAWLANRAADWLLAGERPNRLGNAHPSIVPYQTFRAADGHVNVAVGTDAQFRALCAAVGRPDLAEGSRFATNALRVEGREELVAELAAAIATRTVAEWVAELERAGVPGGPVLSIPDVFAGPAAHAVEQVEHPTAGALRLVRSPLRFDGEALRARRPPPLLGEHAEEVLAELDYAPAQIERLLNGPCAPR